MTKHNRPSPSPEKAAASSSPASDAPAEVSPSLDTSPEQPESATVETPEPTGVVPLPRFRVQSPDGVVVEIEAETPEDAVRTFNDKHAENGKVFAFKKLKIEKL